MTPPPFDQKIRRNDFSLRPHQETKVYGIFTYYTFYNKNLNPSQQSRHFLKKTPATFRTRRSNYM